MQAISIPTLFTDKIPWGSEWDGMLKNAAKNVAEFISNDPQQQPFFKNYTDHGVEHLNQVLKNAVSIISPKTLAALEPAEVFCLASAILIHDIALHISPNVFYYLIEKGSNDQLLQTNYGIDSKSWKELYYQYLDSLQDKEFPEQKLLDIYGEKKKKIHIPKLRKNWEPHPDDYFTIGEFIRRHHDRYAHEVAILGFFNPEKNDFQPLFGNEVKIKKEYAQLIGAIARSHNCSLDALDPYLSNCYKESPHPAFNEQVKYLMAVLRIADYMEIDNKRCGLNPYRYIRSKRSYTEHKKHQLIPKLDAQAADKKINIYINDFEQQDVQIQKELKDLINGLQKELNDSNRTISKINSNLNGEKIYELTFNEVSCPFITYGSQASPKIRPYKYYSYYLEAYLDGVFERSSVIKPGYHGDEYPNSDNNISDIFYPMTLRELISTRPENVVFGHNGPANAQSIIFEILTTEPYNGAGISAKAGYGKTTLSKALFCFFYYRLKGLSEQEKFWETLHQNADISFIPLLFKCRPNYKIKTWSTIEDFFTELACQANIADEKTVKGITADLLSLFNQKKTKLLIIIDAIDELSDGKNSDSINIFLKFLSENILINNKHCVILTKRDGLGIQNLKRETKKYEILDLSKEQQIEIIKKLIGLKGFTDDEKIKRFLDDFQNDEKFSPDIKRSPFTLINSFYYYDNYNKIPNAGKLDAKMMEIFFIMKNETLTPEIRELLFLIALKIRELDNDSSITETQLFNLVRNYLDDRNLNTEYTARELINLLSHKVGLLARNIHVKNEVIVSYSFAQFKHLEHLLDLVDIEGVIDSKEINASAKLVEFVQQTVQKGPLTENDFNKIANLLKKLNYG